MLFGFAAGICLAVLASFGFVPVHSARAQTVNPRIMGVSAGGTGADGRPMEPPSFDWSGGSPDPVGLKQANSMNRLIAP